LGFSCKFLLEGRFPLKRRCAFRVLPCRSHIAIGRLDRRFPRIKLEHLLEDFLLAALVEGRVLLEDFLADCGAQLGDIFVEGEDKAKCCKENFFTDCGARL
jgi:hypothetical protein